jgi:hypothetical protein
LVPSKSGPRDYNVTWATANEVNAGGVVLVNEATGRPCYGVSERTCIALVIGDETMADLDELRTILED